MSQISKCYKVTVVLSYWEASGEVWELSYKSILFDSSKWSYCTSIMIAGGKHLSGLWRCAGLCRGDTSREFNQKSLMLWNTTTNAVNCQCKQCSAMQCNQLPMHWNSWVVSTSSPHHIISGAFFVPIIFCQGSLNHLCVNIDQVDNDIDIDEYW